MNQPIVERVARALSETSAGTSDPTYTDCDWPNYVDDAKAALEASHHAELVEALKLARPRLAHKHACWSCRPSEEWAEHGSASFENCDCEIKVIDALLAKLEAGDTRP